MHSDCMHEGMAASFCRHGYHLKTVKAIEGRNNCMPVTVSPYSTCHVRPLSSPHMHRSKDLYSTIGLYPHPCVVVDTELRVVILCSKIRPVSISIKKPKVCSISIAINSAISG